MMADTLDFRRVALLALLGVMATACMPHRPEMFGGAPEGEWRSAITTAQAQAARGDFETADTVLSAFALRHPGTSAALETAYWRGVYKMDPSNRAGSLVGAMALLDGYLSDTRPRLHVAEATTLRRLAGQMESSSKLLANATAQAREATSAANSATARDATVRTDATAAADAAAEIKRLKDELGKANAELDRIKKRLSAPPPKP